MKTLLVLKENIRAAYSKYETYITPLFKFLLALISLLLINRKLGYMTKLDHMMAVMVVSLLCSFLPYNFMVIAAAAFIVAHLYALSIECAVVVLALFLLLFLLYFRLAPKDALLVLLTPLCFMLKIPVVIPLSAGLLCTPASVVSVAFGTVTYYLIDFISVNAASFETVEAEKAVQKIRIMIDGIRNNKLMFVVVAAFAITTILVFLIRRRALDYAWTIAMLAGAILNMIILLVGELIFDLNISIIATIVGTAVSVLLVWVIQFFVFNVDYTRTEHVQFEDDEYYYYVKAVPKITVAAADKSVKRINIQRKAAPPPRPAQKTGQTKTRNGIM